MERKVSSRRDRADKDTGSLKANTKDLTKVVLTNRVEKDTSKSPQMVLNQIVRKSMENTKEDVSQLNSAANVKRYGQTSTNAHNIEETKVSNCENNPTQNVNEDNLLGCEEDLPQDSALFCEEEEELENTTTFRLPSALITGSGPARRVDRSNYQVNPQSLQTNHPEINHQMKLLLLDWMMEVSAEFDLRRETFYLAYHYLNMYIDKTHNIQK